MKLARTIILLFFAIFVALIGCLFVLEVRRELRADNERVAAELKTMGRALRASLNEVLRVEGRARAGEVLRRADDDITEVQMRWVLLAPAAELGAAGVERSAQDGSGTAEIAEAERAALLRGEDVTVERADATPPALVVFVPITSDTALELEQPLEATRTVVLRAMEERLLVTLAAVVGAGLLAIFASVRVVGPPLAALADQARRIGAGDLDCRLELGRRDELGELAVEINGMCERLAEAQARTHAEVEAKLKAVEQLRHAERLSTVGTLASGMAHELGTPLSIITGRAKTIATMSPASEEAKLARIIQGQAERMTKIMRGVLDFARRKPAKKSPTDLRDVSRRTLDLLAPLAKSRGVTLRLEEGPPTFAEVDVVQIEQALANLVVNGVHAAKDGGALNVVVGLSENEDGSREGATTRHAFVAVSDDGPGIPKQDLARVFEPFFTTKDVGEGTGLGLSVTYGIMQDHGGYIDVTSEPGEGTCFSLFFPFEGARA